MADGGAGVAVVGRVVHLGIEQRRLQHAGGEVDVVHLRVVVGVDGGRRHLPLGAVHRLADLGQLALGFEDDGAVHVAQKIVARDADGAVVAPLVGIADLVRRCRAVSASACCLVASLIHGSWRRSASMAFSISWVMASARALVSGGEGLGDEDLAQRFAQVAIHVAHAALPARLHLGDAAQVLAVEIEVGIHEGRREVGRLSVRQVPAQVGLPVGDGPRVLSCCSTSRKNSGSVTLTSAGRGQADGVPSKPPSRRTASAPRAWRACTCGRACRGRACPRA